MVKKIPTIAEVMPQGILQKIAALQGVTIPWTESNSLLDIDYVYRWSGYKSISPLVKHILGDNETLDNAGYNTLAGIIWSHYGTAWKKKYDALKATYNPLQNYDMTEHELADIDDAGTGSTTGNAANNSSTTTSSHSVYGYNSSSPTPSDSDSITTNTGTSLSTTSGNNRDIDRTLTRSGNIGVTTSQQMLESELALRAYRFFEEVFKDIDRLLVLPIYDGEIIGKVYTESSGGGGTVSVTSVNGKTGVVTLYGDDINLTALISQSVADAISNLNTAKANKPTVLSATATGTTVSFNNAAIGDDSIIDIYMDRSDVSIDSWTQTGTNFTLTLGSYTGTVNITIEVYNG